MPPIKSEGIVLKKFDFRETSVILSIYTENMGKIKGVLKGVRSEKSKIAPLTFQPGSHIFTLIYKKRGELNLFSSPSLLNNFEIKEKKNSNVWFYILNLLDIFTPENLQDNKILHLTLEIGNYLEKASNPEIVLTFFKTKFIKSLGYGFHLEKCISCNKEDKMYFFSGKLGGIICRNCNKKDINAVRISFPVLKIMRMFDTLDFDKIKIIKSIHKDILNKLNFYINTTLHFHSDIDKIWWENEKNLI